MSQKKKPVTLDHLRSKKKPIERSVRLVSDPDLRMEHTDLKSRLVQAKTRLDTKPTDQGLRDHVAQLQSEFNTLDARVRDESIKFKFRSLGFKRYDELVAAHLMDEERIRELVDARKLSEEAAKEATWDPDTFPHALIAECMVEPDISGEDMLEWMNDGSWNATEIQELFGTAMSVNVFGSRVDLGNG